MVPRWFIESGRYNIYRVWFIPPGCEDYGTPFIPIVSRIDFWSVAHGLMGHPQCFLSWQLRIYVLHQFRVPCNINFVRVILVVKQ